MSTQEDDKPKKLDRADFIYMEIGFQETRPNGFVAFDRNKFGTKEQIPIWREKQNNKGLYRSAFMYDNMDPYNSNLFSDFFMDFDSEDNISLAQEDLLFVIWVLGLEGGFGLPLEAFHIYFSGKKGFHLLIPWQYFGIQPHANLDKIFKWIAEDLHEQCLNKTIDLVIYEKRRLYRLENSIHSSTGYYKIPLQYEEAANFSIEQIQQLALANRYLRYPLPHLVMSAVKQFQKYVDDFDKFEEDSNKNYERKPVAKLDYTPDYVQKLIDEGPIKGQRNETAAALTSFWKNQGLEKEDIWQNLQDWSQGEMSKQEMGEIKMTMNSILKRDLNYSFSRLRSLSEGEPITDRYARNKYKERKGNIGWKK